MSEVTLYEYRADVLRVVDGDTVDLRVDLGFGVRFDIRARLYGINAPETYGVKKDSAEWARGHDAKSALEILLETYPEDDGSYLTSCEVRTIKDKVGKYGRWLAVLYRNGENINERMVELGVAEYRDY